MTRFVLANADFAKRKSVRLRKHLATVGHRRSLSLCQTAMARIYGYASLSELVSTAGRMVPTFLRPPASIPREEILRWSDILRATLGLEPHVANAAVAAVAPGSSFSETNASRTASSRRSPRHGCAIFDDRRDPGAGWASVGGRQSVRFASVEDLDPEVVWLSDLPYETVYRRPEIGRRVFLESYACTKPAEMLDEHGRPWKETIATIRAQFASHFFARVMDVADRLMADCGIEEGARFGRRRLMDDLTTIMPAFEQLPKGLDLADHTLWVGFTVLATRLERGIPLRLLRYDRCEYARRILSCATPTGEFSTVERSVIRTADRWRPPEGSPSMVDASFSDPREAAVEDPFRTGGRRFLFDEYEMAIEHHRVSAKYAYLWERSVPASSLLPGPALDFLEKASSWEEGVVAECLWRSLSPLKRDDRRPLAAPWVAAADRRAMETTARSLFADGIKVASYGLGWVRVQGDPDVVREAAAARGMTVAG